ncbi:MAG: VWA domain-containing protein [Ignavibacteriales bacterium]|nr:VWA domain-containing protein [Ignavibacteriales bacterium]
MRIIREVINAVPEGKGTNLKVALEHLNSMISKRAIVFLISDFQDSGYDQILKTVAKKHLICVVFEDDERLHFPN